MNLGATAKFPRGKIHASDEGELRFAVYEKDGNVVIDFGKAITWLGFPRDIALKFAECVRTVAEKLPHSA
jgi:hypothetical protein